MAESLLKDHKYAYLLFCSIWFCSVLCRSMGEEDLCREVFDEYISRLQEKAKEKERKREEEKVMQILMQQVSFNWSTISMYF